MTNGTPPITSSLVTPPQEQARLATIARLQQPGGSLGRLTELGSWIAACQGNAQGQPIKQPRMVIFAGDHGVATPENSTQTSAEMRLLLAGNAVANTLSTVAGTTLHIFDLALSEKASQQVARFKVRNGNGSVDRENALTAEQARTALEAGKTIADNEVDTGADLLIAGHVGAGSTIVAATLIAALTRAEPVAVVDQAHGANDLAWMRETTTIRNALRRARAAGNDPLALLEVTGGADLAALTGFLMQAAIRRTPVLLDNVTVSAAALLADQLAPGARQWWAAGHRSTQPAHSLALRWLDLRPILELDLDFAEGTGALTALPIVLMAAKVAAGH